MQRQKAVSAHFYSKQILPFGFGEQYIVSCVVCNVNTINEILVDSKAHLGPAMGLYSGW